MQQIAAHRVRDRMKKHGSTDQWGWMDLVRWSFDHDVERGVLSNVSIVRSTHACASIIVG
jgi:hypothetical protein